MVFKKMKNDLTHYMFSNITTKVRIILFIITICILITFGVAVFSLSLIVEERNNNQNVVIVDRKHLVTINNQQYIPVKLML